MPMNRVQFQPGLSMAEFMDRYGTDEKCEAALVAARWASGLACPACGGPARTPFRPVRAGRTGSVGVVPAPVQRHQWHRL